MATLSGLLTKMKKADQYAWLNEVSCVPLQQCLRHLSSAWRHCFSKRAKRPRFKSRRDKQSAEFTRSAMKVNAQVVTLAKISGPLDLRWSRSLPSHPTSCTVTQDKAGRYNVSFVVEHEPKPVPTTTKQLGVDLGLTHFAITSEGVKFDNPRFLAQDLAKLARAQRALCKKQKGSNNRRKAQLRVAKLYARIADKRRDHAHKLSTQLIRENQAIAVETLAVKNMVKNRRLSRAISDVGWGMFVAMLEYKAHWYGRTLLKLERFYPSSKTCSSCEHVVKSLPLAVRQWDCPQCGASHDRDINAAINIKRAAGLVDLFNHACGEQTPGAHQLSLFAS